MLNDSANQKFIQGFRCKPSDADFEEALKAVVDYRGDVSLHLKNGQKLTGYVYHADPKKLDMFPRDSSRKESVSTDDIFEIELSGEDTAKGKSWEDWVKKKSLEKGALHPQQL